MLTAIYTATRGVFALMKGMNVMYGVKDDRPPLLKWIIAGIYTIITVLLLLSTGILLVLADSIREWITKTFPKIAALVEFIINVRMTTMLIVMIFFFLLIYLVLPNRRSRLLYQLPGAVFSALGWVISSVAFSFYLEHFANYSQIYGSLTTIIIAMIWVYMLMSILFIGALVNVVWYNLLIITKKNTSPA
jgi:membrane protein